MTEMDRIRHHLVKPLGARPLAEITREELQKLLDSKACKASKSVVSHLRFRLRALFALAMSEGAVDRNPATELYTPRHCLAGKERRLLSPDDLAEAVRVLPDREHIIVRLATFEGMRPGEILALQVHDLDLSGNCLWVRRRLYKGNIDTPKSDRSARQVALSAGTEAWLEIWLNDLPNRAPDAWLFPNERGTGPVGRDSIWRWQMQPAFEKIGLGWATFQVMRRTHATRAKEAGVDAHTRSAQMGNTVDVNENEYAVSDFQTRLAAVRKLEATLSK
jgi:integrase